MTLAKFLAWTVFSVALFAAGHHSLHARTGTGTGIASKALFASPHATVSPTAAVDRCVVVAGSV